MQQLSATVWKVFLCTAARNACLEHSTHWSDMFKIFHIFLEMCMQITCNTRLRIHTEKAIMPHHQALCTKYKPRDHG